MIYKANDLRHWNVEHEIDGRWLPARPLDHSLFPRLRIVEAWRVLIGRYDALDWEDQ
mgnify:CR=1 FL=1